LVVAPEVAADVRRELADLGLDSWVIGRARDARSEDERVVLR